ncbi:MAG: hypothetical protein AAGD86_06185 [Pseudomonadota bacterium]
MTGSKCFAFLLCLGGVATAVAQDVDRTALSPACEEALALSALPARLRGDASIYRLVDGRFSLSHEGTGPFTCIVARNHPEALIPQCVDAAGVDTILPGIIQKSAWALDGMAPATAKERFEAMAAAGTIRAPARAGINYMMSAYNLIWNAGQQRFMHVGPHVMYYAPNVTDADIGGSMRVAMQENRGTPMVLQPGIHGYMASFVEHASDSSQVHDACGAELGSLFAATDKGE